MNNDMKRFIRIGAEQEYVDLLKRQARLKKLFPGINKAAQLKMLQDQAARARAAKRQKAG